MPPESASEPLFLLIVSLLVVFGILIKTWLAKVARLPPVVGFIVLGFLLRLAQHRWNIMIEPARWTLEFLAQVGVVALLFFVGLRSDVKGLARQLPRAAFVWVWDVGVSVTAGVVVTRALGWELVPSLFAGAAMSATSVGVSVNVWEQAKLIRSRLGELLIDVAELDDVSAVLLMLAVITAAPVIEVEGPLRALPSVGAAVGSMLVKVVVFAGCCYLFARHLEGPTSAFLARAEKPPDRGLTILAVGFAVAAIAGWIGFSVAVGALFAGLIFSRDARAVREEAGVEPLHAFFTPFFFIDIGYSLEPDALLTSLWLGVVLLIPVLAGKILGGGVPLVAREGVRPGLLLGLSLVPRAEIALLVARAGNVLGSWALPDEAYGGLVVAFALASTLSPLLLARLLERWKEDVGVEEDASSFSHGETPSS